MDFKVTFWGVRGSKPTPGRNTILFGGNTSCVQIEAGKRNLIFDGGTGIAELGNKMMKEEGRKQADIFFSHLHWDHIQGLPFFEPIYYPENCFCLYGEDKEGETFQQVIEKQMCYPYFPITMEMMKGDYKFINIAPNQDIDLGEGIKIKTFAVNHPNGCLSYRIEKRNSVVVYCTDTETIEKQRREKFLEFIRGADVFIYDTHFTDEEYIGTRDGQSKKKWGHSTWEEGTRISREADIGYLILYHYKENRNDREQQEIEIFAQQEFKNTVAAREGMIITVGGDCSEKVVISYPY
ncbi:MAG: MBL fold metallo-hydrolase [Lutispora sp.]|nr:MBL fold metallo-hydrolase [Lutispora sp.]MDD4835228.1 MBL fold metallo-hydrolase [Lutispora sp.]